MRTSSVFDVTLRGLLAAGAALALAPATAGAQLLPPLQPSPPPPSQSPSPTPSEPTPNYSPTTTQAVAPVAGSTPQLGSTTAGANGQRTSYVNDPTLVTPLEVRWTRSIPQKVVSVVYGDGLGYAATTTSVMAFDLRTGATVWTMPGTPRSISFGNGVVVSAEDGALQARAARTGAPLWRVPIESITPQPPLVTGAAVYANASDDVRAYSLATGALLWTTNGSGAENTLLTDGPRVFSAGRCDDLLALDAATGVIAWRRKTDCFGGRYPSAITSGGRVFDSGGAILDATNGGVLGFGTPLLALVGNVMISGSYEGLRAVDLGTRRQLWRTGKLAASSSGYPAGDPLVVAHSVYAIGDENRLLAFSLERGTREQTLRFPVRTSFSDSDVNASPAAAPGTLLVPGGRRLTAYQSVYRPAPNGVDAGAPVADVAYGKRATVAGVIGTSLRGGSRKVVGQVASYRRKRFRNAGSFSTGIDGFFSASVARPRNFRTRILAGAARSKVLRIYVYPRYRVKLRRAGRSNRIRASVRVAVPKGIRLRGRRVVLYQGQPGRKRYVRLGASRLRGAGKGRGRATVRFRAIRRASKRDFLLYCIPHMSRRGLGRADVVDRRCGRARLPLR